jgi:hypothetical protein
MKRRYDIVHAIILVSFLVIANFIDNAIIRGIILLLFAAVLIINTAFKLIGKNENSTKEKIFYGILLFLDIVLATGALYVIVSAVMKAL